MNAPASRPESRLTPRRLRFAAWLLMLLAALVVLAVQLRDGLPLETNVMALLPASDRDPVAANAIQRYQDNLARQYLLLVGSRDREQGEAAIEDLAERLRTLPLQSLRLRVDAEQGKALFAFYAPYRAGLLADADRQALLDDKASSVVRRSLQTLYGPLGAGSSALLESDPLLLFQRFLSNLGGEGSERLRLDKGYLVVREGETDYRLLSLELPASPFDIDLQETWLPQLNSAIAATRAAFPEVDILDTGVLRYAAAGVESAQQEMSTIGLGSLAGVIVVFLLVFRSPQPLLFSLLTLGTGFAVALAGSLLVFEKIHLLTLVFGSSLIGIAEDYNQHFYSDWIEAGDDWQPERTVSRILAPLCIGLTASVIGFSALFFTPFPGMQQIALFCSLGLIASLVSVLGLLPMVTRRPYRGNGRLWLQIGGQAHDFWRKRPRSLGLAGLALAVFIVGGLLQLEPNDDVRLLQAKPEHLLQTESRIRAITGQAYSGAFVLVQADSAQALLERSEAVSAELRDLQTEGLIRGFDSLDRALPSLARQADNRRLLHEQLLPSQAVQQYAQTLGFDSAVLGRYRALAGDDGHGGLSPETWLQHPVSAPWRQLWIGELDGVFTTVLPLRTEADALPQLAERLQQPGARLVDPAGEVSQLLKTYRERAPWLVLAGYALVFLLLGLRYGPRLTPIAMLPPALAALAALAALGWIHEPLHLFHLLALLLVLGFGVDYSLFLMEGREHPRSTMLALILSSVTTILAFGLLALSDTPAIHGFGLVVWIGISTALLLAPVTTVLQPRKTFAP